MLGKLLKYEFKATTRIFLPMIILLVIMTPLTKLAISLDIFKGVSAVIPTLTMITYILLIIGLCVTAFIFMIYRFYKNLMTEEGYLMFTLPVSVHSLVLSKAIVAFFWTILCYALSFLSIVILIYKPDLKDSFLYYYDVLAKSLYAELNISLNAFIIWSVVLMVVSQIYFIFYAYCSIALGQLYGKHKILGAIAAAFAIYVIMQVISSCIMLPLTISGDISNFKQVYSNLYLTSGCLSIAVSAIFYFITTKVLEKKLNLS